MDKIVKFCQQFKIQVILRIQNNFLTTCQTPLEAAFIVSFTGPGQAHYNKIFNTVKPFQLVFVKAKYEISAYFVPFFLYLLFYPLQKAEMNV